MSDELLGPVRVLPDPAGAGGAARPRFRRCDRGEALPQFSGTIFSSEERKVDIRMVGRCRFKEAGLDPRVP